MKTHCQIFQEFPLDFCSFSSLTMVSNFLMKKEKLYFLPFGNKLTQCIIAKFSELLNKISISSLVHLESYNIYLTGLFQWLNVKVYTKGLFQRLAQSSCGIVIISMISLLTVDHRWKLQIPSAEPQSLSKSLILSHWGISFLNPCRSLVSNIYIKCWQGFGFMSHPRTLKLCIWIGFTGFPKVGHWCTTPFIPR